MDQGTVYGNNVKSHNEMLAGWKQDPAFKREYDALEAEFMLLPTPLNVEKGKRDTDYAGFTDKST